MRRELIATGAATAAAVIAALHVLGLIYSTSTEAHGFLAAGAITHAAVAVALFRWRIRQRNQARPRR